jgi:hypothetical protein
MTMPARQYGTYQAEGIDDGLTVVLMMVVVPRFMFLTA